MRGTDRLYPGSLNPSLLGGGCAEIASAGTRGAPERQARAAAAQARGADGILTRI